MCRTIYDNFHARLIIVVPLRISIAHNNEDEWWSHDAATNTVRRMTKPPPEFKYIPKFPMEWCGETSKFHCELENKDYDPLNCPFCNFRCNGFNNWRGHVRQFHNCRVTLVAKKGDKQAKKGDKQGEKKNRNHNYYALKKLEKTIPTKMGVVVGDDDAEDFDTTTDRDGLGPTTAAAANNKVSSSPNSAGGTTPVLPNPMSDAAVAEAAATTLTTTATTNSLSNDHSTAATGTPTIHDDQHPHRTSISTAPHNNDDDNNHHDRFEELLAEQTASPIASNHGTTAPPPPPAVEEEEEKDKTAPSAAGATTPTAMNKVPPNSAGRDSTPVPIPRSDAAAAEAAEEEEEPLPMLTQDHAPPIIAAVAPPASTTAAAAVTLLLLPDPVPSESVPAVYLHGVARDKRHCEQVLSSSVDIAMSTMTTTTKRGTTGMLGGKKKKRMLQQRQEVNDGSDDDDDEDDDEDDDDRSPVPQLPANMYDKLPPKLRNDALWQQASTKYEQAQSLLGKCQNLWTTTQQQQQQQEQNVGTAAADPVLDPPITVLHSYALPAIPAKVAPPSATTDYLIIAEIVYEYAMALSEHNTKLETYIAAMEAWTMRIDKAAQHWFDQSERRHQSRIARQAARQAFVAARITLQRAEVHEADAQRAEQQALAALLASTSS
jgi:hypothetical protein